MKALVLAAGYGTRLYPLTRSKAKPLLDVGGRPMIEHVLQRLETIDEIDRFYMIINEKFLRQFKQWMNGFKSKIPIELINDGSTDDSNKLGAIADIDLAIQESKVRDHLLIVAGDNLFDFNLKGFWEFFHIKNSFCVGLYRMDEPSLITQYSNVKLDSEGRIIDFVEKPSQALSKLIAICMYIFPARKLTLIKKYLNEGNNPDAPGYLIQWLITKEDVYGYEFTGKWLDIGDIHSYRKANKEF